MTAPRPTICLCMIVKDEAPVIARCLASVRPLIDHWIVLDTGSRDGTQQIVRAALAELPGELVERPWRDFAHNRTEALELARPHADYSLIIDADDELRATRDAVGVELQADSYVLDIRDTNVGYQRTQLVKAALPWRYKGVLHEFLTCDEARTVGRLPWVMQRNHDGRRRRDPLTYRKDAAILEQALARETEPFMIARYTFYLAQSWRDCGEREKALAAYLARAELGFWDQEVFVSLLNAARLMEALGRDPDQTLAAYARAGAACPTRAEAAHDAARLCRRLDRFEQGYAFAHPARGLGPPADALFVETWIYDFGLQDELSIHAYWTGRYRQSLDAALRLLSRETLPAGYRERIAANARFAFDRLDEDGRAPPRPAPPAPAAPAQGWRPDRPLGGTEIMVEGLTRRLAPALSRVDLQVNAPRPGPATGKPLMVWLHHDVDQADVQWCRDPQGVSRVARFVFVSEWQKARYLATFGLPPDRCAVIRHATGPGAELRLWRPAPRLQVAYTSTPFRGLDVLLDAWEALRPAAADLHIWSSMRLYGPGAGDEDYGALFERARAMDGVTYEGLAPNAVLRARLREIDILAYPSTFAETACLSVIEAMSAGCRVVCRAYGALPETTHGFARLYTAPDDRAAHAALFAETLAAELAAPWAGAPEGCEAQQAFCAAAYGWDRCVAEWRSLIETLTPDA
jgi:glycosyltransferase involved in cell wall biosynthesis